MIVLDACLTLLMSMIKHKLLIKLQVLPTKGDKLLILRLIGDQAKGLLHAHTADTIRADVMIPARIVNCLTHSVCAAVTAILTHANAHIAPIVINRSAYVEYSLLCETPIVTTLLKGTVTLKASLLLLNTMIIHYGLTIWRNPYEAKAYGIL